MFNSISGFSDQLFVCIFLVVICTIFAHFMFGNTTKHSKISFTGLVLILAVGTQLFYLISAAVHIPADQFYNFNVRFAFEIHNASNLVIQKNLHRNDCIESDKGGKRPGLSSFEFDTNPCYCLNSVGKCINRDTGIEFNGSNCPIHRSYTCSSISDLTAVCLQICTNINFIFIYFLLLDKTLRFTHAKL